MIPARRRVERLSRSANSVGCVFILLVVLAAVARLRPAVFGTDANHWITAATVVTGTCLFGLRWVISRRENAPGLHWALFGIFMLLQLFELVVDGR